MQSRFQTGLALASAIALVLPASGAFAQAPEAPPPGSHAWNGRCMVIYRIIRQLAGDLKPDAALKRYPWPESYRLISQSRQDWRYRESAAESAFRATATDPNGLEAEIAYQFKVAGTAANLVRVGAMVSGGTLPMDEISNVERSAADCDAGLHFDPPPR